MAVDRVNMEFGDLGDFEKNLGLILVSLLIFAVFAGAHNIATPDEPTRVGFVEIEPVCSGIDAGVCLGIQKQTHVTFNYDNYTEIEEGTPNYYRKVEAELMLQAQNICNADMTGYEWTSEASYDGQTGEEWRQDDNVELLGCEQTFFRKLNATR